MAAHTPSFTSGSPFLSGIWRKGYGKILESRESSTVRVGKGLASPKESGTSFYTARLDRSTELSRINSTPPMRHPMHSIILYIIPSPIPPSPYHIARPSVPRMLFALICLTKQEMRIFDRAHLVFPSAFPLFLLFKKKKKVCSPPTPLSVYALWFCAWLQVTCTSSSKTRRMPSNSAISTVCRRLSIPGALRSACGPFFVSSTPISRKLTRHFPDD